MSQCVEIAQLAVSNLADRTGDRPTEQHERLVSHGRHGGHAGLPENPRRMGHAFIAPSVRRSGCDWCDWCGAKVVDLAQMTVTHVLLKPISPDSQRVWPSNRARSTKTLPLDAKIRTPPSVAVRGSRPAGLKLKLRGRSAGCRSAW